VIELAEQPQDEVRFGATVTIETVSGERAGVRRTVQIVGVDEASAAEGRIAFTAPLAKALLGKQEGDRTLFNTPAAAEELEIAGIRYL
jgi:transcription elongation factor GreB